MKLTQLTLSVFAGLLVGMLISVCAFIPSGLVFPVNAFVYTLFAIGVVVCGVLVLLLMFGDWREYP